MGIVSRLLPLNLEAEKQAFFQDTTYNPQFTYNTVITTQELEQWGHPQTEMFELAHTITRLPHKKPIENPATLPEIQSLVSDIESKLELPTISIVLDPTLISRGKIKSQSLVLKDPLVYTTSEVTGMINHEIQTHLLRALNEKKQPWKGEPRDVGDTLRAEEGLAILNAYQHIPETPLVRCATGYISIYLAQNMGFAELFQTLVEQYNITTSRAWTLAVRAKRGLTDTSVFGGCTKDICYLEGAIAVWEWLSAGNDPRDLYLGKLPLASIESKKNQAVDVQYPTFLEDVSAYKKRVHTLGIINRFETVSKPQ